MIRYVTANERTWTGVAAGVVVEPETGATVQVIVASNGVGLLVFGTGTPALTWTLIDWPAAAVERFVTQSKRPVADSISVPRSATRTDALLGCLSTLLVKVATTLLLVTPPTARSAFSIWISGT